MLETINEKKELSVKGVVNGITYNINYITENNTFVMANCQCTKVQKLNQPTPEGVQEVQMSIPICDIFYSQGRISVSNVLPEEDRDAEAVAQFKKYLKEITPKAVEVKTTK